MLKSDVLAVLEQRDSPCSGSDIAQALGVSRAAVWKAVEALRKDGYSIESATNRGYWLTREQDILSPSRITSLLETRLLGKNLVVLDEADSTNTYLKEAARQGAPQGTVVVANHQTGGRGRMGRAFLSPPGSGIYMSLLLRPGLPASDCTFFTVATAVCTCQVVEELTGVSPQIKWVNDLLVEDKKLCGILTEAAIEFESGMADFVVVGIGINTARLDDAFPPQLRAAATSVEQLSGRPCFRNRLIAALLNRMDEFCADPIGHRTAMLDEYRRRLSLTGRKVRIVGDTSGALYTAITVDDNAHLIVEDAQGNRRGLSSGEVSVLPVAP